jgi:hypothetical protein
VVEMESLLDVAKEEIQLKGKIVEIKVVGFEQAFKNPEKALSRARNPEQAKTRKYAVIKVSTDGTEFTESHGIPKGAEYDEKKNVWKVTDKAALKKSFGNLNNWFTRYELKYKKDPQVGDEVEITTTPQGFYRIAVGMA